MVSTLAVLEFCHIFVTLIASPIILHVTALAGLELGIVEITIVATPSSLLVTALAGLELGNPPPVLLIAASSASLHVVSVGVTHVAGGAGPIILNVVAFFAGLELWDIKFAIFAMPVVLDIVTLGTGL